MTNRTDATSVDCCLAMERACRLALKVSKGEPFTRDEQIQAGLLASSLNGSGRRLAKEIGIDARYPEDLDYAN